MYHIKEASGVRRTCFSKHFFPPPGHRLPQVLLFVVILQLKYYKENETNANVSSPDRELWTYSHLAVRDTFFAPTKQACHLLARPPSVMGLAGNALSSVCTEWAFSVLNAAHQTSGLKSDFPLGCEVPLSQKNSAFKLCKTPFSWFIRICMRFSFSLHTRGYPESFIYSKSNGDIQPKELLLCCFYI